MVPAEPDPRRDRVPPAADAAQHEILARLLKPFGGERAGPAASRLLDRFGSLAALLGASPEALEAALAPDRDIARMVAAARELVEAGIRETLVGRRFDPADASFLRYLQVKLRGRAEEELHVVFLDQAVAYLRDEPLALGGLAGMEARFRPLFRRAFELNAAGIVLAHNHPSGDPRPSQHDIAATRAVRQVGAAVDVALLDHLIVAGSSVTSMARAGCL